MWKKHTENVFDFVVWFQTVEWEIEKLECARTSIAHRHQKKTLFLLLSRVFVDIIYDRISLSIASRRIHCSFNIVWIFFSSVETDILWIMWLQQQQWELCAMKPSARTMTMKIFENLLIATVGYEKIIPFNQKYVNISCLK